MDKWLLHTHPFITNKVQKQSKQKGETCSTQERQENDEQSHCRFRLRPRATPNETNVEFLTHLLDFLPLVERNPKALRQDFRMERISSPIKTTMEKMLKIIKEIFFIF